MQIQVRVEEHLIIRSWFVVVLLCGENIFYINLMHAQNMSRSKPKKSLVTIQRGHFMNSVFVNPGIYSCAVDDFVSPVFIESASKKWVYRPAFQCLLRLYLFKRLNIIMIFQMKKNNNILIRSGILFELYSLDG